MRHMRDSKAVHGGSGPAGNRRTRVPCSLAYLARLRQPHPVDRTAGWLGGTADRPSAGHSACGGSCGGAVADGGGGGVRRLSADG